MESSNFTRRDLLAKSAQLTAAAALLPAAAEAADKGAGSSTGVTPFRIEVPQARLDWIRTRLSDAQWPDAPDGEPWAYGASLAAMKDLVAYWLGQYDWRKREAAMNMFPQFKARVEDYDIHFIHVKGSGRNPQPIIISHGWPGSFTEFLKVIDPLAHPEKYGGKVEDAFTVVAPSLPGFGFSSKPPRPIGTRRVAYLFNKLMTENLGYSGYIAQGGDYGSPISIALGFDAPKCKAVHLNFLLGVGSKPENDAEQAALKRWQQVLATEGGYIAIQGTKPLSLSYGMTDSPLAVAAWLMEKFKTWSDLKNGDPWSIYTRDEILDNIMVYLANNTFGTSTWMYAGGRDQFGTTPIGRVEKPTGVAHFPGELVIWPKSYAERNFNLIHWSEMSAGGHFAAMEQPKLYIDDVRAFRRKLKA